MPPTTLTPWASDANYTSGADTGTPTKVAYSAGAKRQGFLPGTEPSAQGLNEELNDIETWINYLAGLGVGEMAINISGAGATGISSTGLPLFAKSTGAYLFTSDAIPLPVGSRILFVRIRVSKAGASDAHVLMSKYATNVAIGGGVPVPVNVLPSSAVTGAGMKDVTIAVSSPVTIATGEKWYLQVDGTDTGDIVVHLSVFWDRG